MNEEDVKGILAEGSEEEKRWLTARILTSAKYEDVWRYLRPRQVASRLLALRMRASDKKKWVRAFEAWGYALQP